MEKLKKNLETSIVALQDAEAAFHQSHAAEQHARNTASATHTLKAKAAKESAHEQILERASAVEAALAAYKTQLETDYHDEMQAATVETRALHVRRLELEAEMADLAKRIEVATAKEQPAVDTAYEKNGFAVQFANYANTYTVDVVRLTQQSAAV